MDVRDLKSKTVRVLRRIAADLEIPGRSKLKKAELVALIELALATGVEAPEVEAPPTSATRPEPPVEAELEAPVEAAREPSEHEVYIDRGPPLPETYDGTRVRVMTRDPDTLFVYWEVPDRVARDDWHVAALDAHGNTLHSFRVSGQDRNGYLRVSVSEVRQVAISPAWYSGEVSPPFATVERQEEPSTGHDAPAPWVRVHRDAFSPERVEERYRSGAFSDHDQLVETGEAVKHADQAPVSDPENWTPGERSGPQGRSPRWSSFQFASHTLQRSKR